MIPPSGTVASGIVDRLRERILTGVLPQGSMLPPERELAVQLGVSRATLRQGLSVLGQMGLVSTQRGRSGGAIVTAPSPAKVASSVTLLVQTRAVTVAQLTEIRRALEIEATQLSATRRTAAELREIEEAVQQYIAEADRPSFHNQLGRRFHYAIARASGNPLLTEMMYSLNEAFAECLDLLGVAPNSIEMTRAIHLPIVEAIRRQNPNDARRAMSDHFQQLEQAHQAMDLSERLLGQVAAKSVSTREVRRAGNRHRDAAVDPLLAERG